MADILIRGMEMPKAQFQKSSTLYHVEGTIFVYPDGKARAELSVDYKERKSHPLVPVPPHGDLMDRDAARETIKPWSPEDERNGCTFDTVKKLMHTMLNRAPTIIPASE